MAEAALTSIAKSALQLFTSLAKDEFLLLWNSEKDLQKLQLTIETISCLLQDVDKLQSKADVVQNCLSRLRNVMYDAEDLFDALAAQVLRKKTMGRSAIFPKEVRLFFSKSNQLGFIVRTAHEVKSLRESLDGIREDMNLCGFRLIQHPPVPQQVIRFDRDKTHSFVHEEDVIGRDQEREAIVNLLLSRGDTSDDRSFTVVAVIGFGGLGKTTLAQLVYNNERVKQGFDVHLWACINDLSNLEQVLIEIIASKEKGHSSLGLEKLQEKLREIIGGKKFVLVLDDVWIEGNWLNLEIILRCGKLGSKVLVTSRSKNVAKCLDASEPCCVDLEVLSEESAWSLFVKKAFHKGEMNKYPELEPLGKKIVSSCKNVPLAIIIVGSLLRQRKRKENTWSLFLENELGKALLDNDSNKSIKNVLMVSYNDLLPHLKLCFAYCALFPKDYCFNKDELVRLWLAQGFIMPSAYNEQCLEELGEEYFFHLVERCFFQDVKEHHYEDDPYSLLVGNCLYRHTAKMHDLLHDVAIDVAKTESILLDKVSIKKGKRDSLRHISIDRNVDDSFAYCSLISDPKPIRTLLFHTRYRSESSLNMSMLASLRMLRTLNLQNQGIGEISDSIGDLIHLRYLNLSNNELKNLPRSICKLHHLMIFKLSGCNLLEKLPPKIEKLLSLRQLQIGGCGTLDCLPPGLTALTSLVNLDRLIVHRHSGGLGYLNGLDNLRGVLRIELPEEGWPDAIEDAKRANMSQKHKLDGMVIDWKEKGSNTAQKMGKDEAKAVLEALKPHQRLEYLKIRNYGGDKLPGWFCMLKNVKDLCLHGCENVEYVEDEMRVNLCFPFLETLEFKEMKNLKSWWRQDIPGETQRPCLAKVSRVTIHDCLELKGQMPLFEGLEYLNLERVDVNLVMDLLLSVNPNCSSLTPFDSNNANSKLQELELWSIKGLVCLPEEWISHLIALQTLNIYCCSDLRLLSRRGLSYLTALKELNLEARKCEIGDEDDDDEKMEKEVAGMPWKALPGLETLKLAVGDAHLHEGLRYLTSLTKLEIKKWKGIQLGDGETGGVQLPSNALQNLHTLDIGFDDDKTIICHLPKAWIQYLHSLTKLKIGGCKELYLGWKTLLINMKLEELCFSNVGSVVNVEDMVVEQPSQLRYLGIASTREAKWVHDIPWKSLASLYCLELRGIGGMEELPDGIQHLTSLRALYINDCSKVRSVPKWFPHLTSLTRLTIWNCSEVKRRCERERGEDWPLIRHIPDIDIHESRSIFTH